MNPRYKEKVKTKLDCMLDVGIIEPIEKSEWIIPIVIQDKKTIGKFNIYVDLGKFNDACLNDPFPTPFIDEVLQNVGRQEMYSFIDGFYSYHQVIITQDDHHKMTFATEWGCYQYNALWTQECTCYFF